MYYFEDFNHQGQEGNGEDAPPSPQDTTNLSEGGAEESIENPKGDLSPAKPIEEDPMNLYLEEKKEKDRKKIVKFLGLKEGFTKDPSIEIIRKIIQKKSDESLLGINTLLDELIDSLYSSPETQELNNKLHDVSGLHILNAIYQKYNQENGTELSPPADKNENEVAVEKIKKVITNVLNLYCNPNSIEGTPKNGGHNSTSSESKPASPNEPERSDEPGRSENNTSPDTSPNNQEVQSRSGKSILDYITASSEQRKLTLSDWAIRKSLNIPIDADLSNFPDWVTTLVEWIKNNERPDFDEIKNLAKQITETILKEQQQKEQQEDSNQSPLQIYRNIIKAIIENNHIGTTVQSSFYYYPDTDMLANYLAYAIPNLHTEYRKTIKEDFSDKLSISPSIYHIGKERRERARARKAERVAENIRKFYIAATQNLPSDFTEQEREDLMSEIFDKTPIIDIVRERRYGPRTMRVVKNIITAKFELAKLKHLVKQYDTETSYINNMKVKEAMKIIIKKDSRKKFKFIRTLLLSLGGDNRTIGDLEESFQKPGGLGGFLHSSLVQIPSKTTGAFVGGFFDAIKKALNPKTWRR
jgi:hypothetical protein